LEANDTPVLQSRVGDIIIEQGIADLGTVVQLVFTVVGVE
jgi:hypothetical protein